MSKRDLTSVLFDDLHDLEEGDDDTFDWPDSLIGHNKKSKFLEKEPDESLLTAIRARSRKTPDFRELRGGIYQDHLVFVYGTLKRGFYNEHFLRDAHYMGLGVTADASFLMYPGGGFPVLFRQEDKQHIERQGRVRGEVYAVNLDTMCKLDMLESNGSMYHRQKCRVVLKEQNVAMNKENFVSRPILNCYTYLGDVDYWKHVYNRESFQTPNGSEYGTSLGWRD